MWSKELEKLYYRYEHERKCFEEKGLYFPSFEIWRKSIKTISC